MTDNLLSPRKIDFLTFIGDRHHDLNTCSFYSNPTEGFAIDTAHFRI